MACRRRKKPGDIRAQDDRWPLPRPNLSPPDPGLGCLEWSWDHRAGNVSIDAWLTHPSQPAWWGHVPEKSTDLITASWALGWFQRGDIWNNSANSISTFLIYFIYFINIIYLICFAMFCNCRYQATSSALRHLNLSNCGRRPALITATSEPFTEESAQRLLNIAPKKLEASGLRRFTRQVSYRLSAKHWISTVMAIYQLLVISGIIHSINGVISTYNW